MAKKFFQFLCTALIVLSILIPTFLIPAFAQSDYNVSTMHTGVDSNSFKNTAEYFVGENEKSKYYVSANELKKLIEGESEDTKNLILSQALGSFKGSCYGISAVMALAYTGKLDISADNFYSVDIIKRKDVRNYINFYQLSQFCDNKNPIKTVVTENDETKEDPLKQIVEYSKIGNPFLIGFRTENFAHEVVGCGYEHLDDGTHRIRVIDPNKSEGFMYLLISADFTSWSFEESLYATEDVIYLDFTTLDAFSKINLNSTDRTVFSSVSSSQVVDTICTDMLSSFTITNANGETLTYENGTFSGEMEYKILKYIANANEIYNTKIVFTVNDSNAYTVQNNGEEIDITFIGDKGLFASVQGKNIDKIEACEGLFTLTGENLEYSVSALSTEKNVQMMSITGADPEKVTFETKNGVTVTDSENGKVHVSLVSNGNINEGDCVLSQGSMSIVYSMIVKSNTEVGEGSEIVRNSVLLFIAIVFAITLVFTYKKYQKRVNKNSGVQNG